MLELVLVPSAGCRVLGAEYWVPSAECRVPSAGCWVLGAGCWVLGAGCLGAWAPGRLGAWRLPAYRIALFLSLVVLADTERLLRTRRSPHIPIQLERAVDSIGVNIAEGYSRFSGRERARFL